VLPSIPWSLGRNENPSVRDLVPPPLDVFPS
jgi:hypothetical protein